jgi:hypothetical protein
MGAPWQVLERELESRVAKLEQEGHELKTRYAVLLLCDDHCTARQAGGGGVELPQPGGCQGVERQQGEGGPVTALEQQVRPWPPRPRSGSCRRSTE